MISKVLEDREDLDQGLRIVIVKILEIETNAVIKK